ncbi:hypothetical protein [Dyadobacter sp. CY351]|uniref:hypothetical protein n=1 Tax=Dyadobacter sp. CY351 TaxID=2909337 RepID=UPI001F4249A2|nr:hypothetical protein [Dyadobacter sp. CY351]MCF2517125.1 hypothetical protein [Dyadobacter sp. CY351]
MDKLIGYSTINVAGKEIPLKFGCYAVNELTKHYKISLSQIYSELFTTIEIDGKKLPTPKDFFDFTAVMLWAGADYMSRKEGGSGYTVYDAFDWIDELGISHPDLINAYGQFFKAVENGGVPMKEPLFDDKDKKQKKSRALA